MAQREAIQQETIQQETTRQEAPQHDGEAPRASLRLAIDGMHCANCAANIEKHYRRHARRRRCGGEPGQQHGARGVRPSPGQRGRHARRFRQPVLHGRDHPRGRTAGGREAPRSRGRPAKRDRKVFGVAAVLTVVIVAIGMIPGLAHGGGHGPGGAVRDRSHPCAGHVRGEPLAAGAHGPGAVRLRRTVSTRAPGARSKAARRTWTCSWRSAPPSRFCSRCGSLFLR